MPSLPLLTPNLWLVEGRELVMPGGRRIDLYEIQDWALAAWGGNQNIQTDRWKGWRIVQQYIVPPFRSMKRSGIHIGTLESIVLHAENEKRVRDTDSPTGGSTTVEG